jgi:dTDP-4-dehydrorhamnose 3,5-epimerase
LALKDDSYVMYKADNDYKPESEDGIIWNDPNLRIDWGTANPILSDKDKTWKTIKEIEPFE